MWGRVAPLEKGVDIIERTLNNDQMRIDVLAIIGRRMGYLRTHSAIYSIQENGENRLHPKHT